ncbi:cation:proton antiporter [Treponema brennaborense]|uniref:Sodium/hydrogen exchanger n=1 Tax=Treponema brennaborense (strain DSM 12168 / CIP 105900 / DD5/3) TaxID=906968 RepID=F4LJ30_TREBD|nr:cation:proton antiporter [Treponema brennaborense]AEE16287.1 sodium/hydrogen exchanger [Treponema brennaborense DSM 12168]
MIPLLVLRWAAALAVLECTVGLLIGTELIGTQLKRYGTALFITTLTQSLGTFVVVSAVFAAVFACTGTPPYLSFIFGAIALATAPAPALSIVREFRTAGPVSKTLIPMAALDDMVGVVVFFTTIAIVARHVSGGALPLYMIPVMIVLPLLIGTLTGVPAGYLLKKTARKGATLAVLIGMIAATAGIGLLCNTYLMPAPLLNFMLLGIAMIAVILNLGAPLDYRAIAGAGLFTFVYIVARACGKYFGARVGAKATGLPVTVQKYLGFTLLPCGNRKAAR